jgi:hypothetical protein
MRPVTSARQGDDLLGARGAYVSGSMATQPPRHCLAMKTSDAFGWPESSAASGCDWPRQPSAGQGLDCIASRCNIVSAALSYLIAGKLIERTVDAIITTSKETDEDMRRSLLPTASNPSLTEVNASPRQSLFFRSLPLEKQAIVPKQRRSRTEAQAGLSQRPT